MKSLRSLRTIATLALGLIACGGEEKPTPQNAPVEPASASILPWTRKNAIVNHYHCANIDYTDTETGAPLLGATIVNPNTPCSYMEHSFAERFGHGGSLLMRWGTPDHSVEVAAVVEPNLEFFDKVGYKMNVVSVHYRQGNSDWNTLSKNSPVPAEKTLLMQATNDVTTLLTELDHGIAGQPVYRHNSITDRLPFTRKLITGQQR